MTVLRAEAVVFTFCLFTFAFLLVRPTNAQPDPLDTAPPPLRTVTKEEKASLEALASDVKARTKLALDYMNIHLTAAEQLGAQRQYDAMFRELGGYHGVLDNTLLFLTKSDTQNKKVLDNLKRLEIGLRETLPRLEVIHRELPFRYEDYVRKLIAFVRNARTRALDPLFSDTVVKPTQK